MPVLQIRATRELIRSAVEKKTGLGKTSQQRYEYDVLKQVMLIAYDANKLDLRTNSCCLSVWLFIQPSLVSVF